MASKFKINPSLSTGKIGRVVVEVEVDVLVVEVEVDVLVVEVEVEVEVDVLVLDVDVVDVDVDVEVVDVLVDVLVDVVEVDVVEVDVDVVEVGAGGVADPGCPVPVSDIVPLTVPATIPRIISSKAVTFCFCSGVALAEVLNLYGSNQFISGTVTMVPVTPVPRSPALPIQAIPCIFPDESLNSHLPLALFIIAMAAKFTTTPAVI